ncbi:MAG: hypothetical protein ACK5LS_14325 [Propioniciclava sp.]
MSVLDGALQGEDLVVAFPRSGVADWIVAGEVMLLEEIRAWVFPVDLLDLVGEAIALFGHRARIGVEGLTDPQQVTRAAAAGPHFLTSPIAVPGLADAAGDVPLILGGLTPAEIHAAHRDGADAVQIVPAHVLGSGYARSLPPLLPGVDLMVTGRIERYQAEMWWDAGARAVCTQGVILVDEEGTGSAANTAADVRGRCQNFRRR